MDSQYNAYQTVYSTRRPSLMQFFGLILCENVHRNKQQCFLHLQFAIFRSTECARVKSLLIFILSFALAARS